MISRRVLAKTALLGALQDLYKAFGYVAWHTPAGNQGERQGHKYINKYMKNGYMHYVYKHVDPVTGKTTTSEVRHPADAVINESAEFKSEGDQFPTSYTRAMANPGTLAHSRGKPKINRGGGRNIFIILNTIPRIFQINTTLMNPMSQMY